MTTFGQLLEAYLTQPDPGPLPCQECSHDRGEHLEWERCQVAMCDCAEYVPAEDCGFCGYAACQCDVAYEAWAGK